MRNNLILRPHHVKAFIKFKELKLYKLTEKDYIKRFQEKNKWYHNDKFVIFWRKFLLNLYNNQDIEFLYKNDFDEVCKRCDIKNECENKWSKLNMLVEKLDNKSLEDLWLIEWKTYKIRNLK